MRLARGLEALTPLSRVAPPFSRYYGTHTSRHYLFMSTVMSNVMQLHLPIISLQIWMWERLPVGRPHSLAPPHAWFPEEDPVVAPTVAHLYERASGTYHVSCQAYISYTNELDILQPQHVRTSAPCVVRILELHVRTSANTSFVGSMAPLYPRQHSGHELELHVSCGRGRVDDEVPLDLLLRCRVPSPS
jgi:hypothetical protein